MTAAPTLTLSHVELKVDRPRQNGRFLLPRPGVRRDRPGGSGPEEMVFLSRNPGEHHQIVLARSQEGRSRASAVDHEVFTDTPWHVAQPMRFPIHLSPPDDVLGRETEARIRQGSDFQPAGAWRADLERQLGQGGRS